MSRRRRERGRWRPFAWLDPVAYSPIEVAAGSLLLVVLGLVALVWGAAFLSSLLARGEPADVGVGDAVVAMARLGANGLSWEGVWDPATEPDLAGPRWFWAVFAVEALAFGLLFWPLWRLLGPRPGDPMPVVVGKTPVLHPRTERRRAEREAAAQSQVQSRDLVRAVAPVDRGSVALSGAADKILVTGPDGRRLILGRVGRSLVATEDHHSVIVFGPTRSGKTSALSVPAILEWEGPVLVCTAKADLVTLTWDARMDRGGRAWLVDPMATMKRPASGPGSRHMMRRYGWSPLEIMESVPRVRHEADSDRRYKQWALARRTAQSMVRAAGTTQTGDEHAGPAAVVAESLLAPLLLAAVAEERPMGQVGEWLDGHDHQTVSAALERTGVAEAVATWDGTRHVEPSLDAAARRILAVALYSYGDPAVTQGRDPGLDVRQLFDGRPNTLYVLVTPQHGERLRPLVATLVSQVADAAMGHATASRDGRMAQPLLVVFDDALNSAPATVIDQLAATGAGMGIQVLSLFADLGQMERAFGRIEAAQLANNHRARVVMPGITDGATLNYVSGLIQGNRMIVQGDDDALGDQAVGLSANWMRTLEDGRALCIYGNLPPIKMELRPWYGDDRLRALVEHRPTQEQKRQLRLRRERPLSGGGFPNPLDSEANNREAERYWQAVVQGGTLPEPRPFDDGSAGGPLIS